MKLSRNLLLRNLGLGSLLLVAGCHGENKTPVNSVSPAATQLAAIRGNLVTCKALLGESPAPVQAILDFVPQAEPMAKPFKAPLDASAALVRQLEVERQALSGCLAALNARLASMG